MNQRYLKFTVYENSDMNKNKFYLTTAIPYVNGAPHIGHAYEFVITDAIARYHRLIKDETLLLTGADENALKNVQAAEKLGITTQQLCDQNSEKFRELFEVLNAKYDVFQRSSNQKTHWPGAQKLWQLCNESGDIYKKSYKGLYCISCELFYVPSELLDSLCPVHKIKPEEVEEENYFFKLSKYQNQIVKLIESDEIKISPEFRKNETLSFVKQGLEDISISRSNERAKNWGVPVPNDETQRMYVWFDALDIYQTGVGFGTDEEKYNRWWPANLHVIGKDIFRFHTVYWPAILLSAKLKIPKAILIHGFLNIGGEKMSKTLGNIVDPFDFISNLKKNGIELAEDALRYYLLTQPIFDDGDFSEEKFKEIYNADLANGLGNLVSRLAKLCENNSINAPDITDLTIDKNVIHSLEEYKFNEAIAVIWKLITDTDKKVNEEKPWELSGGKAETVLEDLVKRIQAIAFNLQPFLPQTAEKILKQFLGEIKSTSPLFPRI